MPVLGITGGIATGKSTFVQALRRYFPAESFDADEAAHRLMESGTQVHSEIIARFGPDIIDERGEIQRDRLRDLVFSNDLQRRELESILHPRIREEWMSLASSRSAGKEWLIVDIPLLFETGADGQCDQTITVACAPLTQRERLRSLRHLDEPMIDKILGAQWDLLEKIKRAHHIIWNDSTPASLEIQARLIGGWLAAYYG